MDLQLQLLISTKDPMCPPYWCSGAERGSYHASDV